MVARKPKSIRKSVKKTQKGQKRPMARKHAARKQVKSRKPMKPRLVKMPGKRKAVKPLQKNLIPKMLELVLRKMPEAPEDKHFVLKNGKRLKSVYDLVKTLEKMSDDVFSHHVTPYKNDFCAWIYHVFNEVELARMLANEKNKKNTLIIIREYFRK